MTHAQTFQEAGNSSKYFQGKPCRKCGGTARYFTNKSCVACQIARNHTPEGRLRRRSRGHHGQPPIAPSRRSDLTEHDKDLIAQLRFEHGLHVRTLALKFEVSPERIKEVLIERARKDLY